MDVVISEMHTNDAEGGWRAQVRKARWLWTSLLVFAATRLGILLVAYLAAGLFADSPSPPYHLRGTENILVDVFGSRWDTGFYVSIAEEGYQYRGVPLPSVAFFPLFPLMMRTVGALVGDMLIAGIIISNSSLLLATMLLYRLTAMSWGQAVAERTIWYLLIFPTAFFGTAVYSESLFLLAAIGALYSARRGYWLLAGLLGIAAALTRFMGLIVAPMLLAEWWMQRHKRTSKSQPSRFALLAAVAVPLGTLVYAAYLERVFGDPLAFVHGAAAWARQPQSPLVTLAELLQTPDGSWWPALRAGHIHFDNWLDLGFVLVFLALGLVLLFQRRWSEGIFVTLGVAVALSSGLLMSQRRYVWVLFPAFVLLAQWGGQHPWVDRLISTVSLLLLGVFTALFANGYWVG